MLPRKYRNGLPMPPEIYGGYNSVNPIYFAIVENKEKGKIKHVFTDIPVIVDCSGKVDEYIKERFGQDAKILKYIYKYQLIKLNGQMCYITGASEQNNACQFIANKKFEKLLWLVDNKNNDIKINFNEYKSIIKEFIGYYTIKLRRFYPLFEKVADALDLIKDNRLSGMNEDDQIDLIKKMLILTSSEPKIIKLQTTDGDENSFGRLRYKVDPDEVVWIDRSITGLRERSHKGV